MVGNITAIILWQKSKLCHFCYFLLKDSVYWFSDTKRPSVRLSTTSRMKTRDNSITVSIKFVKPVFGFNSSHLSISGGRLERQVYRFLKFHLCTCICTILQPIQFNNFPSAALNNWLEICTLHWYKPMKVSCLSEFRKIWPQMLQRIQICLLMSYKWGTVRILNILYFRLFFYLTCVIFLVFSSLYGILSEDHDVKYCLQILCLWYQLL